MKSTKRDCKLKTLYSCAMKKEFNLQKYFKQFVLGALSTVLIAAVIFAFVGFNLSLSFTNGQLITVNFNTEITSENRAEYNNQIKEVLKDNEIKKYEITNLGNSHDSAISIQFKSDNLTDVQMNLVIEEIRNDITEVLNANNAFDHLEVSEAQEFSSSITSKQVWLAVLAIALVLVAVAIYAFIRFDFTSMLSITIANVHNLLLFLALLTVLRVPVSALIFVGLALTALLTSLLSTNSFAKIQEGFLKETNLKLTNAQVAEKTIKSSLITNLVLIISATLIGDFIMVINKPLAIEIGAIIVIGTVLAVYANFVITLSAWSLMFNRENDKRLQDRLLKKNAPKKKDEEQIVV